MSLKFDRDILGFENVKNGDSTTDGLPFEISDIGWLYIGDHCPPTESSSELLQSLDLLVRLGYSSLARSSTLLTLARDVKDWDFPS